MEAEAWEDLIDWVEGIGCVVALIGVGVLIGLVIGKMMYGV